MTGNREHPARRERASQRIADALRALDELQSALGLTTRSARRWAAAVRAERRAWVPRRKTRDR